MDDSFYLFLITRLGMLSTVGPLRPIRLKTLSSACPQTNHFGQGKHRSHDPPRIMHLRCSFLDRFLGKVRNVQEGRLVALQPEALLPNHSSSWSRDLNPQSRERRALHGSLTTRPPQVETGNNFPGSRRLGQKLDKSEHVNLVRIVVTRLETARF